MRVVPGRQGVLLPDAGLAFDDAAGGRLPVVVSHAHMDHVPDRPGRVHATPETAALLARRAPWLEVEPHPYGEPFRLGEARVTLHPSGHVLGAAMALVEHDGETLLRTGDVKLRAPFTCAAAARGLRADTLVVESTFGLPVFRFPPAREAQQRAVAFAREALAEDAIPVFLGWSLGKAQELLRLLGEEGVPVQAHGAAWNLARVYAEHGVEFPDAGPYVRGTVEGHALVVPPDARKSPMVTGLRDARVCYASGWAALENRRTLRDADALLPLSDHCDFDDLLRLVEETGAREVVTDHGYADVFAHVLRSRGIDARDVHAGRFEEEDEPAPVEEAAA